MIQEERIKILKAGEVRDKQYVLYWMQQSQRADYNHALEYAVEEANRLGKPLIVYFGITESYPHANERHYRFMLEGLRETKGDLAKRGIQMVVRKEMPDTGVHRMARDACLVVTDRGYTRLQKRWRQVAAHILPCRLVQVESDVVVPVETASPKEEYAAATIRKKIEHARDRFLVPVMKRRLKKRSLAIKIPFFNIEDVDRALRILEIDRSVEPSPIYRGGASHAKRRLGQFVRTKLANFDILRNDPNADVVSHMSPYLHFGQISPVHIALEVLRSKARKKAKDDYLEELIVRRELAVNFVYYNEDYDSYAIIPDWAQKTLRKHVKDRREYKYSVKEMEEAVTHDPYWNAAQQEMVVTGKMHGYMRMYWGKKILEWVRDPQKAFDIAIYLNDKYELDGRDPNSYAGVAWCFGKHDRPWPERKIFGKVRYMNDAGLKRKFDVDAYVEKIDKLRREYGSAV